MELLQLEPVFTTEETNDVDTGNENQFINANTSAISLDKLRTKCIIPVFAKDNESTVSHSYFIEAVFMAAQNWFKNETILAPAVRVSHPVKGRVPSAMEKPAKFLTDEERTVYYERMAFAIEIPSIRDLIGGNDLSLTVGGVRAYNQENLYSRKSEEKFKIFVGFKNKVCTNLCISTDGFIGEVRARYVSEIAKKAYELFRDYDPSENVRVLGEMVQDSLNEKQFATLVGRSRMYQYLPQKAKKDIPKMPLLDSQVSTICKDYYSDESVCRNEFGDIDLWRLYNLFTNASKSSYIDTFLERGVGSHLFVKDLQKALKSDSEHWFVS